MIAQDQEGEKGGDRNVSLLNKSQPEKAGRLSAELWMGDFPSETAGNRESSGIPSSHRKRCLTSLSTHPMERRAPCTPVPVGACPVPCLQSPMEGRFYDSHFRSEVR